MTFHRWLLPCSLLMLLACSEEEKRPGDLISEDKMAKILADIHLAEAQVTSHPAYLAEIYEQVEKNLDRREKKKKRKP